MEVRAGDSVHSNQRGNLMVQILILVPLLAAGLTWVMATIQNTNSSHTRSIELFQIDTVRRNLASLVQNQNSWGLTIKKNPSMKCLFDGVTPCMTGGKPIKDVPFV